MFGMGTGGSLRLLSPETKLSLDSSAAARSRHPVGHQRPPVCLRSDSRSSRPSSLRAATMSSAPSKPHRLEIRFPLTKILPHLLSKLSLLPTQTTGFGIPRFKVSLDQLRSRFPASSSCSLFPVPFLRSSPRPISIIKLHTLPHFHR